MNTNIIDQPPAPDFDAAVDIDVRFCPIFRIPHRIVISPARSPSTRKMCDTITDLRVL